MPLGGIGKKGKASPDGSDRATRAALDTSQKVAVGVTVAAVLAMGLLFGSGVTDKMVQAKARSVVTTNPSAIVGDSGSTDTSDEKRADGSDVTGDDINPDAERDESEGSNDKAPLDLREGETIHIAPGAVVDKKTLTKHLSQMKPEAFLALVASVDRVISETKSGEKGSLEQAYLAAEKKFGSRIDASKRLTLVDELNAVDYKYYVAEKGDTLLYLSQAFGVPLGQLMELNGIGDADKINAGMILLFPLETKQP